MIPPTETSLRWLIVEDALRDRKGHWFEYISTFVQGLRELGDQVTVFVDRKAESFICETLQAAPVLPQSIWHRMSDRAGPLVRYARVPLHAWQTVRAMKSYLSRSTDYDIIFVPTVLVHHLLGWTWLIKRFARRCKARIVLFFPNAPISCDPTSGDVSWTSSPTTRLMRYLFRSLAEEVHSGTVILAAETHPMRDALARLSGLPFRYLPHPVNGLDTSTVSGEPDVHDLESTTEFVLGSYGPARQEKGSDTLFQAIDRLCRTEDVSRCRFLLQCLEGFEAERRELNGNDRVTWLTRYFADGEYARQLAKTHIMVLPYQLKSYRLRVSRVAIEAVVNGIPIVATRGSTLASQGEEFGAVALCDENDPASVANAMQHVIEDYDSLAERARAAIPRAREHFSVRHFRQLLIGKKMESEMLAGAAP